MQVDLTRIGRLGGVTMLLAAFGASLARAEDPEAAQVLKSQGLTQSARAWWTLPGESAIPRKIKQLGDLSKQLRTAQMQQQEFEKGAQNPQVLAKSWREQTKMLEQRIDAYDQELAGIGAQGGNPAATNYYNSVLQERNALVLEHRRLVRMMNNMVDQKQQFQETKQQFGAEVGRMRESYVQAIEGVRKSIDELQAKYTELKADQTVKQALADLGRSTKLQHKLGPSRTLTDAIERLKRFESSIKTENIELHRENGIYQIDVMLNGKGPVRMVFDTGAGPTLISAKLAERLALKPTGQTIVCKTADGAEVPAKEMTISSVAIGLLRVKDVTCVVMPKEKGDITPLFGQSILERFDFKYTQGSGRLVLTKVEPEEPATTKKRGSR